MHEQYMEESRIPFMEWACKVNGGPLVLKPKMPPPMSIIASIPNNESLSDTVKRMKKERTRYIRSFAA